ncbi:MAG: hypothetical protein IT323_14955 [Anaerolineae bacterium]|nr:hypothetical protein [Anaerolineae bacterium]
MLPETRTFLNDCFAGYGPDEVGYLTLTAIHPAGNRPTPSRHVRLGDVGGLERTASRLMRANARGWGAYFGVALRKTNLGRWGRGGKCDLISLPALFVDIDDADMGRWQLGFFEIPASSIVHTGRGYHAYWFLDTPTTDLSLADRIIHGLALRLGGDPAISVAHSMRLPGTRNTKPGRAGAMCTLEQHHPERCYPLSDFEAYARLGMPARRRRLYAPFAAFRPWSQDEMHSLRGALTDAVFELLDGRARGNGYIAARCPFPHQVDRPGMHFSYNAETGWGRCWGKHGSISPGQLCRALGVPLPAGLESGAKASASAYQR